MALLLRAEAKGLFLQPCRDLATPARTRGGSAKQPLLSSEKDVRGSHKKPGELLTALSLRAEAWGLFLHPERKQATQARTRKLALGGSKKRDKKGTEPVTVQGFEGWASKRFRQPPQGNRVRDDFGASLYEAEAQASKTLGTPKVMSETGRKVSEWDPTVGRHRATGAQRTASVPTRETLRYPWSASLDH